jgi:hypothetical protein
VSSKETIWYQSTQDLIFLSESNSCRKGVRIKVFVATNTSTRGDRQKKDNTNVVVLKIIPSFREVLHIRQDIRMEMMTDIRGSISRVKLGEDIQSTFSEPMVSSCSDLSCFSIRL